MTRQTLAHLNPEQFSQFEQLLNDAQAGRDARGPVREVQAMVGDHWASLLLLLLHYGPLRFSVLQRIVNRMDDRGISRRMLAVKLRALRRDGLVSRKVTPTVPLRVDYALTSLGEAVFDHLFALVSWLRDHRSEIEAARATFQAETDLPRTATDDL